VAGQVSSPLLVPVILSATSLGIAIPVLKDSDRVSPEFGQLVIAAASIADFGAVILLPLGFSRESTGTGAKIVLQVGSFIAVAALAAAITRAEHLDRLSRMVERLQDTTA
jgi:Kef-type K+ transport system membrane component KefB